MDLLAGDYVTLITLGTGLAGIYVSYASKIKVMEKELESLHLLVTELRLDIKELLAK